MANHSREVKADKEGFARCPFCEKNVPVAAPAVKFCQFCEYPESSRCSHYAGGYDSTAMFLCVDNSAT